MQKVRAHAKLRKKISKNRVLSKNDTPPTTTETECARTWRHVNDGGGLEKLFWAGIGLAEGFEGGEGEPSHSVPGALIQPKIGL